MTIVVFGASGFIGQSVTKALVAQGQEVIGIARTEAAATRVRKSGATPIIGDMTRPETWADAVFRANAVVQLAASFDNEAGEVEKAWLDAIIKIAEKRQPFKIIYTGGCWLFPAQTEPVIRLDTPFDPLAPFAYMVAHRAQIACADNLQLTTIHPGMVWGETGGFYAHFQSQVAAGTPVQVIGSPDTLWPLVHVDDLAAFYALVVRHPCSVGDYLAVAEPGVPVRRMIRHIADRLEKPVETETVPVALAIAEKGEGAAGYARSQRICLDPAAAALGWRPKHYIGAPEG